MGYNLFLVTAFLLDFVSSLFIFSLLGLYFSGAKLC